jgi:hypothetical protein
MVTDPASNPPGSATDPSIPGPPLPDDVEQLKRLRAKFSQDARFDAQDTFAKWLFGLTTTVGALGTGFSNAAFAKLSSWGVFAYSLSVLAAGAGLACAVFALGVELPEADWQSLNAMIAAFRKPLRDKKSWLISATVGLGISLICAATAVFLTAMQRRPSENPSGISFRLSEHTLEPAISLVGLSPGSPAELQVFEQISGHAILVGVFRQIADETGQITYKAAEFKLPSGAQSLKLQLKYERAERQILEEKEFALSPESETSKESSTLGAPAARVSPDPSPKAGAKRAAPK